MDPSEVEFLGEKEFVVIVPKFNHNIIHLISGDVGPFEAGSPVKVPIWFALILKKQQKCRIIAQEWMDPEILSEIIEIEKNAEFFTKMPSDHFMDEAQMLLSIAADDISEADNIRTAVKDIWDLRMAKLRSSIISFVQKKEKEEKPGRRGEKLEHLNYAKLDHLTSMEINSMRSLLPNALDSMHQIEEAAKATFASQSLDTTTTL